MKLSIVVLICDKDYNYFNKLYNNIKEVINIDYEVIVIDNREKCKDISVNFYDCVVHTSGSNIRQYNARRIAMQYVTGDYVWYVDGDDLLLATPKLDTNADLITVDYAAGPFAKYPIIAQLTNKVNIDDIVVHNSVPNTWSDTYTDNSGLLDWNDRMWGTLWFKIIKRTVLERAWQLLPETADISSCEDLLLSTAILAVAKSITVTPDVCYYYCSDRSLCDKGMYTADEYAQLLYGQDTYQLLVYNILKRRPAQLRKLHQSNAHWFIKHLLRVNKDDFASARDALFRYFDKEYLIKAIIDVYATNDIDEAITMLQSLKEFIYD